MKKTVIFLFMAIAASVCLALKKDPDYRRARQYGAMAKFRLCVVDDEGRAVSNASVKVFMGMNFRPKGYWIEGETDGDGTFIVHGRTCGDEIEILVSKDGFYDSKKKLSFARMGEERDVVNGKWQPYDDIEKIQLRNVRNPVRLKTFGFGMGKEVPATNVWIGVDMCNGDYVMPYGKGTNADFEIKVDWDGHEPRQCDYCAATMRFQTAFSGGRYEAKILESDYPYVFNANANACYSVRQLTVIGRNRLESRGKILFASNAVLVTRTRCEVDENGKLKSACYGYIRAFSVDASWDGYPTLQLACVFNPTPNDTNLEPQR